MQHYTSRIRSAKLPTNRPTLLRQGDSPEPPATAQGGGACDPPGRISFAECKGNCRCIFPADSDDGGLATFIFRLWSDERPETLFANAVRYSDQRLGKCSSSGNLKNTGLSCYLPQVDLHRQLPSRACRFYSRFGTLTKAGRIVRATRTVPPH